MIWVDGKILPDDALAISVADRTFEHGLGLFETLRTWGGRPTLLDRHRARMLGSAEVLGLPIDPRSLPDEAAVRALLDAEGVEGDRLLRITATGGTASGRSVVWMRSGPIPAAIREGGAIVCVNSWAIDHGSMPRLLPPLPNPPPQGGREPDGGRETEFPVGWASPTMDGPKAVGDAHPTRSTPRGEGGPEGGMRRERDPASDDRPPPLRGRVGERGPSHDREPRSSPPAAPTDFTARHKTLNYWFKRVAYEEARARNYDETLIHCPPWGCVEASRSNLFLVTGETLTTFSPEAPIVPGIMRQLVLDASKKLPLDVQEIRTLDPSSLRGATEVFLTNAVRGIIPVARVDAPEGPIERPAPGPWTRRLQDLIARQLWPGRGDAP